MVTKKKKVFKVPVQFTLCATMEIEAENIEKAVQIAEDGNLPPFEDCSYLEGSFQVFEEEIE